MSRGLIEGKEAREYAKKIKLSKNSIKFNKFILDNIKLKNSKICDLCCGSGDTINLLMNKSKEIVGIDASNEMIVICKEKFSNNHNVKLKLSSATETGLKNNYFDYVIIRMGLHHIKDKQAVINESFRILKPEGKLIIIDKYYINKLKYYLFNLFNNNLFNEFIISKKGNLNLLNKFNILKEKYEVRRKTTQIFLFLLEKQL